MTSPVPSLLLRLATPLAVALSLAGCGALEVKQPTLEQTEAVKKGPEAPPFRTITGFSAGLRCMDGLMIDHGVRDVSMLVEELLDSTKKINAGIRDMLITAMSEMTKRSRAVRLVAYGKDATNVISFLQSAQRLSAYEVIPQFDIKGSITQWDENLIRNENELGLSYRPYINLGISRDAASSILALDLSVLRTDDLSLLAGVTSRNSVVILRQGKGVDGDAAYHKFGISYAMNFQQSEGQAQALRGLVELAVIELMGKLTRTPYWTCLGVADGAGNEEILHEISDWYYAMASNPHELISYFQHQLRRRGFYEGPVDGEFNPAIDEAIANYRVALGLSKQALIDPKFFEAYLLADHSRIPRPAQPARLSARPAPLVLLLAADNNRTYFKPGEPFNLMVGLTRDAHLYCYLQDETARITRFFPNRFSRDSLVPAAKPLLLPGAMRFQLSMNTKGVKETIACFATERDVSAALPAQVVGTDFEPLAVKSIDQLRSAFANASAGDLAEEKFNVQAK